MISSDEKYIEIDVFYFFKLCRIFKRIMKKFLFFGFMGLEFEFVCVKFLLNFIIGMY